MIFGVGQTAGAVACGGPQQTAPANPNYQVGSVGFGPAWSVEDSMAASNIRLEQENQELKAEVAVAEQERAILVRETERLREQLADSRNIIESLRDDACRDKCREKAAADGGWANI